MKWAGGKSRLLEELRSRAPKTYVRYFEPFVGSGAVFFDLVSNGHLNGHGAVLSDDNADLIACYRRVRRSLGRGLFGLRAARLTCGGQLPLTEKCQGSPARL